MAACPVGREKSHCSSENAHGGKAKLDKKEHPGKGVYRDVPKGSDLLPGSKEEERS